MQSDRRNARAFDQMDPIAARSEMGTSSADAYVDVALPVPVLRTFQYKVPVELAPSVSLGSRVVVPFGKRKLTGYVVGLAGTPDAEVSEKGIRLRAVEEVSDEEPLLTEDILELTRWTSDYYAVSWGELLKASLPAGLTSSIATYVRATRRGIEHPEESGKVDSAESSILSHLIREGETPIQELRERFGGRKAAKAINRLIEKNLSEKSHRKSTREVKPKTLKAVRLVRKDFAGLSAAQERVINALSASGGEALLKDLQESASVSASPVETLVKAGVLQTFDKEIRRDPLEGAAPQSAEELVLTPSQDEALARIGGAVDDGRFKTFLLHGVTGSGKTEVYIRAIKRTLAQGRSALMLVPEIALTPVFSKRLRAVFGEDVAILHSSLAKGERFDEWRRIREGEAKVAIGTRSAVFAPLKNLGLVVVDEEHDPSYRQHEMPFYHGRDVALVRAMQAGAVAVLGSATPALESFFNARSGKYDYIALPGRIGDRPLATAEIVDLRQTFKEEGSDPVVSPELRAAIADAHAKGEQSMILLNRRGFSQFVLCRSCGETIKCVNCDITLTYHKGIDRLVCHYCNYRMRTPPSCPSCESAFLYFLGEGTEQLEKILRREFPQLKIARIDRDTTRKKKQLERLLHDFSAGKIDMLVGTQMIAKGHDFPNVTLVGVVSVDTGLALPDFRSAERTFQLLTQVAGRAGRGDLPGRVLIQTFHPDHYALVHAREQDYEAFYEEEINYRRRLSYPPFTAMASILIKNADIRVAAENAQKIRRAFGAIDPERACSVLGPAPAALGKLKGEHRLQMIVRARNRASLRNTVNAAMDKAAEFGCEMRMVSLEIDPVNLL